MTIDWYARFPFVAALESNAAIFRAEAIALEAASFRPMPASDYAHGEWSVFPLELGAWISEFPGVDLAANRARCPGTMRVLAGIEGVVIAGFTRLDPGAEIAPHTDPRDDHTVRCHVGLVLPSDERARWPEGRGRLMDVRVPHGARNNSSELRQTLLVDVQMPFVIPTGAIPVYDRAP